MRARARTIDAVLFDFGNTLFAHAPLAETVAACAHRLGRPLAAGSAAAIATRIDRLAADPSEAVHRRDLDAAAWTARWLAIYGSADDHAAGLGAAIFASMHDPRQWQPYARTAEVVAGLDAAGVAIGVVSNTGWDVRGPFIATGLDRFVGSFTLSCEAGAAKPDPRIFATACASLDAVAARTLMVGDDVVADGGAVAAGLRTVLLPVAPIGADNGIEIVLTILGGKDPRDAVG